jgi:hypothetical protein
MATGGRGSDGGLPYSVLAAQEALIAISLSHSTGSLYSTSVVAHSFASLVNALKGISSFYASKGIYFWRGQRLESPDESGGRGSDGTEHLRFRLQFRVRADET